MRVELYGDVPRLLLVTHRSIDQDGGPSARWRSLARRLPELGWEVDVVCAPVRASAVEFGARPEALRRAALRARVMARVGAVSDPVFALAGVRPEAMPLSMAWVARGARDVRRRLAAGGYDALLATGPPMVALLAARLAAGSGAGAPPLVVELRDLWAGSPAFDRGGPLLGALERWAFARARAVVACTPEAADDLRARHPHAAERVVVVPNGFEPELLARRPAPRPPADPLTLLHSGTISPDRPLGPLLTALARAELRDRVRLVLHGHLAPAAQAELAAADGRVAVELLPPSPWAQAVERIAAADAALVTQARGAGDATAVASKVYEYLALGRPVLALTDGGATEALLRRLGADALCARLDDPDGIARALARLTAGELPAPLPPEALAPYDRAQIAAQVAALLDRVAGRAPR
ncbi:MAG: glycosyltransferase [Actinobacteria bacterium]|nr:glycosyltransferase [Actinomycetota bacterium]